MPSLWQRMENGKRHTYVAECGGRKEKRQRSSDEDAVTIDDYESKESAKRAKRTTPGIPTWSPTVVLTGPEDA